VPAERRPPVVAVEAGDVQTSRYGQDLAWGCARQSSTAHGPGTPALGREDSLSDRDLLFLGGQLRRRGVLAAAVRGPRAGVELHAAEIAVAGVDSPVATGFATGYLIPFAVGGRDRLTGQGNAAATKYRPGKGDLGDADVGCRGLAVTSTHTRRNFPLVTRLRGQLSGSGSRGHPADVVSREPTSASPQGVARDPSPADRWVPRLHPDFGVPRPLDGARRYGLGRNATRFSLASLPRR
ncbi:Mycobacterium rhizamassiliense ORFan, partial [Mycobacterium rhizamassiliense]